MRAGRLFGVTTVVTACVLAAACTREHASDLPAGPIQDRHELMEGIGKNAKAVGDAMKAGDFAPVGPAAENIAAAAPRIPGLFPAGSTHAKSRAKDDIWVQWAQFEQGARELETTARVLAGAATGGGDVPAAAKAMFGNCKNCHERFRKPEEKNT